MTKITGDKDLIEQAIEVLTDKCGGRCNAEYNPCHALEVADALRAALAEPAVEPVVCTNKQAMEVRNSIGLMKDEDERNNYGNHATAIKVLEAFLASPPPPAKPQPAAARSGVFGYLDGEVRKDMAGFYEAFDLTQPPPPAEVNQ